MKVETSSRMQLANKGYYGLETRIFFKKLKVRMYLAY